MNQENIETEDTTRQGKSTCNVNSTFNTTVGITSIIVAVVIGYIAYMYLGK